MGYDPVWSSGNELCKLGSQKAAITASILRCILLGAKMLAAAFDTRISVSNTSTRIAYYITLSCQRCVCVCDKLTSAAPHALSVAE